MFGASVYLSGFDGQQPLWDEADIYFTSLHIAEEFSETYGERAKALLNTLRESGKKNYSGYFSQRRKDAGVQQPAPVRGGDGS